jgi:dephospho-CoA kinase
MLNVGLTGNIASGKSVVAARLAEKGAFVIDADELARRAVDPGMPALSEIVARWGNGMLLADGSLDRAQLRGVVFRSSADREALNAIMHPEIRRLRNQRMAQARARGVHILVNDIPLLFETGMQHEVDRIVLVDAPPELRLARLMESRNLSRDDALRMIDAQMPSEQKREAANYVIENTGSPEALKERVDEVWQMLRREAGLADD